MHLANLVLVPLFAAATRAVSVSYDTGYDDGSRSLTTVACSDGANGLMMKYGWSTQGQVAGFPYIGGAPAVEGWNSANCGTCWRLTYDGTSITVLAIDAGRVGFNIALGAMNTLTRGRAVELGRVEATVEQVPISNCGL